MAELAEQRLKAFEEEFGLIRTRGKGQGMHIPKTKAEKAPGQLLSLLVSVSPCLRVAVTRTL